MTDRKQRAKKRTSSEIEPATPSTSGTKKSRKRSAAQRKAAAEAQRVYEEKGGVKQRRKADKSEADDKRRSVLR